MQHKIKGIIVVSIAFLMLSIILALSPMVSAAGSITLTPLTQSPGNSVTVAGTGFGATKAVGIVVGTEVVVTGEAHTPTGTGTGPYTSQLTHYPIKPGSFSFHVDVSGVASDVTDNGDGTLASTSTYFASGTVNYVTGAFSRSSTTDLSSYTIAFTASYTYYQYTVTPTAGVTTSGSGAFSASITVPSVGNGTYTVTAIDTAGTLGTATLTVNGSSVPESLSIGAIVVLLTAAVVVSTRFLSKRPKIGY